MSVKNSKEPPTTQLHTSPQSPSQFTYQNLHDLNDPATSYLSPLSTIGLVDLNAFFAQVEQIRLGLTDQDPVVCGQWHSLIAVSYAARKYGISRMDTIASAKTKCPNLIIGHAPVYKKGEEYWSYVDGLPNAANHKVSLDMYRRESRKILRVINEKFDLTEKASVDESYIDFGREVFTKLMEYFPELKDVEKDQSLPDIPSELPLGLYWEGEVIKSEQEIADDGEGTEPVIKDWDDVCLVIGSQILLDLRRDIYKELGYTTSAGLARNKLMAKLAGGFKKPDDQTIIRNSSIKAFLKNFELTDITGMGGKLGDSLINQLEVPPQAHTISYIREHFTLEQLKEEIKDDVDLAVKLYHIVRGMYAMELTQRMEVKSMTSTKNFTFDAVANLEDAYGWIKVFSGDLHNRLVDLDNENLELSLTKMETKEKNVIRRPKTLSIGVVFPNRIRQTRQLQIPFYKDLSKMKTIMYENGCVLLREFFEANTNISMVNNNIPCKELYTKDPKKVKVVEMQNMSLTISNFVILNDSALIENFTTKSTVNSSTKELMKINAEAQARKEQKSKPKGLSQTDKEYIAKLFKDLEDSNQASSPSTTTTKRPNKGQFDIFESLKKKAKPIDLLDDLKKTKRCPKCNITVTDPIEHNDYHIALELSQKLNNNN